MIEDLSNIAPNLTRHPNGFWVAQDKQEVSYPAGGNEACYSIEDASFWFKHRNAVITDVVRMFPPDGPIFDIGGGNGYVARGLERDDFPVVLVEPGPAGASNAVKRGVENVVCATTQAAGFQPNTLSSVGLFDVLEHIDDDMDFLAHLKSLMKVDARIYISVPAFQTLWSAEDVNAGHFRRYSKKSLANCLKRAGFTVEYLNYFFCFLPLPVLFFRTIPSLIGLRRTGSTEAAQREHSAGGGLASRLVDRILTAERKRIQRNKSLPFGGSCIAVAKNLSRSD